MILDEWKRLYSNTKTNFREVAIKGFWDMYDPEGYSLWFCDYKYNDENTVSFVTLNKVGGFLQRMDLARKYAFGKMLVIGSEAPFKVKGLWLFRGQEIPQFIIDECYDMELYEWKKVDISDEAQKERVNQMIEDQEPFEGEALLDAKCFKKFKGSASDYIRGRRPICPIDSSHCMILSPGRDTDLSCQAETTLLCVGSWDNNHDEGMVNSWRLEKSPSMDGTCNHLEVAEYDAEIYQYFWPLTDATKQYLASRYKDTTKFQEEAMALPLVKIEAVLSSDDLQVASEDAVYDFVSKWAWAQYPKLEERHEILGTRLGCFIQFSYVTCRKLKKVLTCNDFDQDLTSKAVLEAPFFKADAPHRQRGLAAEDTALIYHCFVERAYKYRSVKVVEFEFPRQPEKVERDDGSFEPEISANPVVGLFDFSAILFSLRRLQLLR
ncbi:unnamed protein product, partial [Vitis vinifera]